ncbi:uncharacterized protein P884DRAFT_179310, partial [Thermothelomyces heterothallicus CBS 202.75]|uniref:uncharacterized protein n=1 Tax=Thermothelomyces heterothallicus CBS 202.75 TaxID=1149848 RepID=UPI003742BD87
MAGLTYPAAIHTHRQLNHDVDQRSISIYDATTDGEAVDDTSAAAPDTRHHHRRRRHHHHQHQHHHHHPLGDREGDGGDGDHGPSSASPTPSPGPDPKPADEATSDDNNNNNHHHLGGGGGGGGNSLLLDPRPSTRADDPLNWSWAKKHAVLAALIPGCLLSDWTLTWGTAVFPMQAAEWYV